MKYKKSGVEVCAVVAGVSFIVSVRGLSVCDYVGKLSTGTTLIYRTILRRSYLKNLVDPDAELNRSASSTSGTSAR